MKNSNAGQLVKDFFEEYDFHNLEVLEVVDFQNISIVKCKEWNPIGPNDFFEYIVKDGKIYNTGNFDDVVEITKDIEGIS